MNIEKLAIEHASHKGYCESKLDQVTFSIEQLEAFAKALQSSEPVFAEYLDDDEEWQKINVKDIGTYEHAMFKTRLLFTHPPASVPLEKILDALNSPYAHIEIDATKETITVVDKPSHITVEVFTKHQIAQALKAIAEAEGKEG